MGPVDAGLQLAAAAVVGEEGVQVGQQAHRARAYRTAQPSASHVDGPPVCDAPHILRRTEPGRRTPATSTTRCRGSRRSARARKRPRARGAGTQGPHLRTSRSAPADRRARPRPVGLRDRRDDQDEVAAQASGAPGPPLGGVVRQETTRKTPIPKTTRNIRRSLGWTFPPLRMEVECQLRHL
jgi:hypothetical protein